MIRAGWLLGMFVVLTGSIVSVQAATVVDDFSDTINFIQQRGRDYFVDYREITNDRSYTHTLAPMPAGAVMKSATLSIMHSGFIAVTYYYEGRHLRPSTTGAKWQVFGEGIQVGELAPTGTEDGWYTDTLDLSGILSQFSGTGPWQLDVQLVDHTPEADKLKIKQSVFSGTYSYTINDGNGDDPVVPTPEPVSLMLLGSGLLAGIALRKK